MNIELIINKCNDFCEPPITFDILKSDFRRNGHFLNYNSLIRKYIPKDTPYHGAYIISNTESLEILYIGMSGQIKKLANGSYGNCSYDIGKRLISSREKNDKGNYVTTSDYFYGKMKQNNIKSITITILKTKPMISPTFIESQILQWIYSDLEKLPTWNKSF
jgi:hypothetical protein